MGSFSSVGKVKRYGGARASSAHVIVRPGNEDSTCSALLTVNGCDGIFGEVVRVSLSRLRAYLTNVSWKSMLDTSVVLVDALGSP